MRNGQTVEVQSSSDETEDDNMFFRFEAVIKDIDDLEAADQMHNALASYLGQMFIDALDSHWLIELNDEHFVSQYRPCVYIEHDEFLFPPHSRLTTAMVRKHDDSLCIGVIIDELKLKGQKI